MEKDFEYRTLRKIAELRDMPDGYMTTAIRLSSILGSALRELGYRELYDKINSISESLWSAHEKTLDD